MERFFNIIQAAGAIFVGGGLAWRAVDYWRDPYDSLWAGPGLWLAALGFVAIVGARLAQRRSG